jgi:tRNA threonylcarbamoyladenosine biosynthesis protein TsaE
MESRTTILKTPEDMAQEAKTFLSLLTPNTKGATLVTLSGELGAGKTTFTQGIAKVLGVMDTVNSPTFVIEKIYSVPASTATTFTQLVHIDAYRLKTKEDLSVLGFDELREHPGTLILLEWPECIPGLAETTAARIQLEHLPDGSRTITYG